MNLVRTAPACTLALALFTLGATGCARPTATATPRPTASVTVTQAATATALPTRTPTPTSSATPMPTPWPLDVPHPVVLTLDDARREVLSWALPVNEARVERALYATVADIAATYPRDQREYGWWLFDQPYHGDTVLIQEDGTVQDPQAYGTLQALDPNQVLILVDASQRGFDLVQRSQDPGADAETETEGSPSMCSAVSSRSRARFVSVFDATTGRYFGSDFVTDAWLPNWVDVLAAGPEPQVVRVASATPTASVTPTVTPPGIPTPNPIPSWTPRPTVGMPPDAGTPEPLATGQVPEPLADAARGLAEVPGAWWAYRVTELDDGVHWSQRVYTETISSAWRIAPDVMTSLHTPGSLASFGGSSAEQSCGSPCRHRLYLFPHGRTSTIGAASRPASRPATLDDVRRFLATPPGPETYRSGDTPAMDLIRLPLHPAEQYNYWWRVEGQGPVTTPAGRFEGCYRLTAIINAGNSSSHWLCPGVGFVRHEFPGCGSAYGHFSVYELIDYDIPPIIPLP